MSIISELASGGVSGVITAVDTAIHKKDEIEAEIVKTEIEADKEVALGQNETNKVEASSEDLWTKRWRPTLGYGCTIGFVYQYVLQPFLNILLKFNHIEILMPQLDMTSITGVLTVLIGARSYDKYQQNNK